MKVVLVIVGLIVLGWLAADYKRIATPWGRDLYKK